MGRGEVALGDPGYLGEPNRIYAPPHRTMNSYVEELDKVELTLQRRVEMANQRIKSFKCVGTVYRKGAVRAFPDLQLLGTLVPKLVLLDLIYNPEHGGTIVFSAQREKRVQQGLSQREGRVGKTSQRRMRSQVLKPQRVRKEPHGKNALIQYK